MKKFLFYSDPAHGYLRVPLSVLKDLGLFHKISPFSFMSSRYAFLEEDMDANTFKEAWEAEGNTFNIVHKVIDHMAGCRQYNRFPETSEYLQYRKEKYGW